MTDAVATCPECGRHFRARRPTTVTCSWECRMMRYRRQVRTGIDRPCAICGTVFYVPRRKLASARYCSRRCLSAATIHREE